MTKPTHTPLPWFIDTDTHPDGLLNDTDRANLDLIVRAVNAHADLLAACQMALEYLQSQNHPRNVTEQVAFQEHQREVLRAAILKAGGGK